MFVTMSFIKVSSYFHRRNVTVKFEAEKQEDSPNLCFKIQKGQQQYKTESYEEKEMYRDNKLYIYIFYIIFIVPTNQLVNPHISKFY